MVRKFLLVLFLLLGGMVVGAAQGDVGTSPNSVAAKVFLFPDRLLQQHRLSAGRPHVSLPPTTPLFPDETFPAVKPYKYAGKEVDFVRFLLDSDLKQDALVLVRQGGFFPSDTLDYLCGKVYFSVRELDAAAQAFSTLHPSSPFYDEGLFYANAADAHMGRPEMALRRLQDYPGPYREMAAIQQAGLSLLCNDPAAYRTGRAESALQRPGRLPQRGPSLHRQRLPPDRSRRSPARHLPASGRTEKSLPGGPLFHPAARGRQGICRPARRRDCLFSGRRHPGPRHLGPRPQGRNLPLDHPGARLAVRLLLYR